VNHHNILIILTGLPASGKSTFAYKLKIFIESTKEHAKVKIVDPDKIRDKISPQKFDYSKEHTVREKNLKEVKSALKKGYTVISDDLNYFTSMRHDLKQISEDLKKEYFIIHIATPIEYCVLWNDKRGNPIPNQVIHNIKKKFDEFGSYSWDIPIEKYDLSTLDHFDNKFENLMEKIEKRLNLRQISIKESNQKDTINEYHQLLDRVTRSLVGNLLQKYNDTKLKKKILINRKEFIKVYLNQPLKEKEISKAFFVFLKKKIKVDFSLES